MSTKDNSAPDPPSPIQALAEQRRRKDYERAERVVVELRAEDPAGRELQIWRTHSKPSHPIQSGSLVSLWDGELNQPRQILRRVTGVRSIEEHWVEFILEAHNPLPEAPDPRSNLTMYLAVPVKWATLHRKTKVLRKLTRTANHLYNTYMIAPDALAHIKQTKIDYWSNSA